MTRFAFALLLVPVAVFAACSSSSNGASSSGSPADADAGDEAGDGTSTGTTQCSAARDQLLTPIDKSSSATVSVVSDDGTTKLIYVDASAGGPQGASKQPRVYLSLDTGTKADLTDKEAFSSSDWDLAIKRTVIYTNSGDAGPGKGGAAQLSKAFDAVTAADADAAKPAAEVFFDADCNGQTDFAGYPQTTFSTWYNYDQATNIPTPKNATYIVKGASGKRYKLAIETFTAYPDGGTRAANATGYFLFKVAAL